MSLSVGVTSCLVLAAGPLGPFHNRLLSLSNLLGEYDKLLTVKTDELVPSHYYKARLPERNHI